jgi:hypothetical protein
MHSPPPVYSELGPSAMRTRPFGKVSPRAARSGLCGGCNITVEARWSGGSPDRLPTLARELASLKPDVIVASSTQAIRAAKDATTTIPIVMVLASFPGKAGLVESLARPGGQRHGLSTLGPQLMAKKSDRRPDASCPMATTLSTKVSKQFSGACTATYKRRCP